jgi:hypothetical protein
MRLRCAAFEVPWRFGCVPYGRSFARPTALEVCSIKRVGETRHYVPTQPFKKTFWDFFYGDRKQLGVCFVRTRGENLGARLQAPNFAWTLKHIAIEAHL